MRLPVPQVSRWRPNQLGNLVRMLELGAINLDASPRVPKQRLGHGFHHARLPRSRWPEKQQVPHRTSRRIQPRQKHLVDFHNFFHCLLLPHNAAAQGGIKLSSIVAAAVGIEHGCEVRSHGFIARNYRTFSLSRPFSSALLWLFPTVMCFLTWSPFSRTPSDSVSPR